MKHLAAILYALSLLYGSSRAADELLVYPPVPGLAASEHYKVRVRSTGAGGEWKSAFAWETVCKSVEKKTDAYFEQRSSAPPTPAWKVSPSRIRRLTRSCSCIPTKRGIPTR